MTEQAQNITDQEIARAFIHNYNAAQEVARDLSMREGLVQFIMILGDRGAISRGTSIPSKVVLEDFANSQSTLSAAGTELMLRGFIKKQIRRKDQRERYVYLSKKGVDSYIRATEIYRTQLGLNTLVDSS